MKTFEERYTAWIDGHLDAAERANFEQELARRGTPSDKADIEHVQRLLASHLKAPALTNVDFFNHQLRERIEADRRLVEARPAAKPALFAWSLVRLAGLGAFCLLIACGLYYTLMPSHNSAPDQYARNPPPPAPTVEPSSPGPAATREPGEPVQMANLTPDIEGVHVVDPSANATTATPMHYKEPDVNVLWIDGLNYLPSVPDENPSANAAPIATSSP